MYEYLFVQLLFAIIPVMFNSDKVEKKDFNFSLLKFGIK